MGEKGEEEANGLMPIMKSVVLLTRTEIKISNHNRLGFCFTLRYHLSFFSSFLSHLKFPRSRKHIVMSTHDIER